MYSLENASPIGQFVPLAKPGDMEYSLKVIEKNCIELHEESE